MRENFRLALSFTLRFEGGYVNHPRDPGGATNKGITLRTLRRWKSKATVADLKAISATMVAHIYQVDYWNKVNGDQLAAGVDGATFDYGVNSGPAAALKSLRAVAGGPDHVTVQKLCRRRLSIYRTFRHWKTFGRGWTNRVTAGEALWVKWALAASNDHVATRTALEKEAKAARRKSVAQGGGAAGSASGGGAAGLDQADAMAAWLAGGFFIGVVILVGFLVWRARINGKRSKAYRNEARRLVG